MFEFLENCLQYIFRIIQVSYIDHRHMEFLRQRYLRYAERCVQRRIMCSRTHRLLLVSSSFRVWPGSLPDVQLWRGTLTGPCPLSILPGEFTLVFETRERNSRWISIGGRRAPPIAKRPCHDHHHRDRLPEAWPIARRTLNFDIANLACQWLTASGGRPGSLSSRLTTRICFHYQRNGS